MVSYSLTREADLDLEEIYEYTIHKFGLEQADKYLLGLHDRFQILVQNPMLGRSADEVKAKLRRFEYQSHIVFYVSDIDKILVMRILHQSMDVEKHL